MFSYLKYRKKYQEINIPIILSVDIFTFKPIVKLIIYKSITNGFHPTVLNNRKKSLTTPTGKIYERNKLNEELIKAPQTIIKKTKL